MKELKKYTRQQLENILWSFAMLRTDENTKDALKLIANENRLLKVTYNPSIEEYEKLSSLYEDEKFTFVMDGEHKIYTFINYVNKKYRYMDNKGEIRLIDWDAQIEKVKNTKLLSNKPKVLVREKIKPPFSAPGKTNFTIQNKPGVYMIYENQTLVYIGYSKRNVYKSLYRHFYPYREKTNQDRKYWKDLTNIKVRVIYTNTPGRAENLEIALIQKYKPKLNTIQYKAWQPNQKEKSILEIYENTQDIIIDDDKDLPF